MKPLTSLPCPKALSKSAGRNHVAGPDMACPTRTMPAPHPPTTCTCLALSHFGHMWALMADKRRRKNSLNGANGSEKFLENKLLTGKFFMERVMPESDAHLTRIQTGAETMMAMDADSF